MRHGLNTEIVFIPLDPVCVSCAGGGPGTLLADECFLTVAVRGVG